MRAALRSETARLHDQLDMTMHEVAGWTSREDYARFLSLQYAARRPVEAWLDQNAPTDSLPPAQTPRIAQDLAALGHDLPSPATSFTMASAADDDSLASAALGAAWVLAGSSLGNRAILAEMRKGSGDAATWPHAFLGDDAMLTFWKSLRRRIERPADPAEVQAASAAAQSVFDHFLCVVTPHRDHTKPAQVLAAKAS
ncbi:hypothetical protein CD351_04180 [Erythrobacter sp. KY5]|nr:hypothetical protein CD351_04180 [Erythrobacter sp. KY5]